MDRPTTDELPLCNLFALEQGIDPIGYAGNLDAFISVEIPLPWPRGVFASSEKLPERSVEAFEWVTQEKPYRLRATALAPDPTYSEPGRRRVLWHERPAGPFSDFDRREYLVPEDEMGELVTALLRRRGQATEFDRYRVESPGRDLLACTHGTRDAACGRFGVPLFERLRSAVAAQSGDGGSGEVRVWRTSHLSGHIFAPTLLELPSGRLWAHLDDRQARQLLTRSGEVSHLRDHYRGWSALDGPFLQALERELLMRKGWSWLDLPKRGFVEESDEADRPSWARARIETAGREPAAFRALVEVTHTLQIRPRSDSSERKPYAQYRVTELERLG